MEKLYDLNILQKFDRNLFIIYRTEEEELIYTYGKVLAAVKEVLQNFRSHNVAENTGIAIRMQGHTPSGIVLLLSTLNHNCYFVPLASENLRVNFETVLNAHGAKYLFSSMKYESKIVRKVASLIVLNDVIHLYENMSVTINFCRSVSNFCYSIGTSGSTGIPKVVRVPYSCVKPNIDALSTQLKLLESDIIYLCAPPTFDPFIVDFFLALNTGSTLLMSTESLRLNPHKLVNVLFPRRLDYSNCLLKDKFKHIGASVLQTTPSFFRLFGDAVIRDVILHEHSTLRSLILGGEEFPLRSEWNSWLPSQPLNKRIFNIYGITEVSCWCMIYECNFIEVWDKAPLGTPLDNHTIMRIIDESGMELRGLCKGQLEIGSETRKCYIPSVDRHFWLEDNETCFRATGDIVRRDETGSLYYLGRADNVIKRMGIRLNLEKLQHNIKVFLKSECRNIKCIWQRENLKLICFIETKSDITYSTSMRVRRLLREKLVEEERPDDIQIMSKFPLNLHGKIDHHCLLSTLNENVKKVSAEPLEIFLRFFVQNLGLDLPEAAIKRSLSFTSAGGTSLQAIALASEISMKSEYQFENSELLSMLLNPQKSLISIIDFLSSRSTPKNKIVSDVLSTKPNINRMIKFMWRTNLNKCVDSSPVVVENKGICVGSHSHIVTTLDVRLGSPTTVLELSDRIECKVEVVLNDNSPNMAIVGCHDHTLYAFSYANGRIYWSIYLDGMIKAKPLGCKSGLIVATYGEEYNLYCICLKTRNYIWRKKVGTKGIYANPISAEDSMVIVCTLDGTYCRILANSGKCVWLRKCDSPIFSTPVVIQEENFIILAEVVGKVHISNAENGELIKTFCTGSPIFSGLTTIFEKTDKSQGWNARWTNILFGCYDKHIYCLRLITSGNQGQQNSPILDVLWKAKLDSNIFAAPIAISTKENAFVFGCSTNGLIVLLLAQSGDTVATYKLPGEVFSTPCNINNQVFIGCRDNHIYSFCIN